MRLGAARLLRRMQWLRLRLKSEWTRGIVVVVDIRAGRYAGGRSKPRPYGPHVSGVAA